MPVNDMMYACKLLWHCYGNAMALIAMAHALLITMALLLNCYGIAMALAMALLAMALL